MTCFSHFLKKVLLAEPVPLLEEICGKKSNKRELEQTFFFECFSLFCELFCLGFEGDAEKITIEG